MLTTLLLVCLAAPPKVHALDAAGHAETVPVLERRGFVAARQVGGPSTFTRTIYGYYPYWASDTDSIPWQHLTHLSYFSVEVRPDGTLGNDHGWSGPGGASMVATGHSFGVQVTFTATLFDDNEIAALLASAAAQNLLIENLVSTAATQGADGVNIDFEFVPQSAKQSFVTFMADLTDAFHASIPGSHVSLASPAVDWNGAYDYDLLAEGTDGLMIMGYGYHWSGSDPGPISPIDSGTTWSGQSLRWTADDYVAWGGVENRHKFVLGFPLYGREWSATSSDVPGTATATGEARVLNTCETTFAVDKAWDEDSQTPFRVYQDGGWLQLFCEDDASLAAKLDLVEEVDFGGAMFWAIGYARPDHSVWDEIDARFKVVPVQNQAPVAAVTTERVIVDGDDLLLDGAASTDPDGDALTYAWRAISGPPVTIEADDRATATVPAPPVGEYGFRLEVSDGDLTGTADVLVSVVAAQGGRAPPAADCTACTSGGSPLWLLSLLLLRRRVRGK